MKRSFFSILSIVLLTGLLNGQCEFFGRVLDVDRQPLAGANIVIVELNKGGISDDKGDYSIKDVPIGQYHVRLSYLGYKTITKTVEVKKEVSRYLLHFTMQPAPFSFDELLIQSTRVDKNAPFAYEVVDSDHLEANNSGQDMPMLLKWTPSVVTTSDAGAGIGYTGMRIRGSDGERINVTINGIPLNDAESQRVYWVDLPDFAGSTDDIQIQRGVGSSTNGAGAFGASINLSTNDQKEDAYAGFSAAVGSFNSRKRSLNFGSGLLNEHFSISGRLSKVTSDGYVDRASSDLSSYAVSAVYRGRVSMLRLNVFSGHEITYQAWYGIPEELVNDAKTRTFNPAGTEKKGEPYANQVDDYRQTHFQLLYDWQLTNNFKLQSAVHYTEGGGFYEEYKADENYTKYGLQKPAPTDTLSHDLIRRRWLQNDFYGALLTGQYTSNNSALEVTFGGAYHQYKGRHFGQVIWARYAGLSENDHVYYDEDATKNDGNIFTKISYAIKPNLSFFGDLQMRRVNYTFLGINDDLSRGQQKVDYLFFNPKIGLTYTVNRQLTSYFSVALANREPNRNDLVDTPVSQLPTAERLLDFEAGINGAAKKFAWKANLFQMSYDNQLALTGRINDVGEYTRINVPKSSRSGLELQVKWMPSAQLDFGVNTTLSQNKVKAFDEYLDTYDADFNWLKQTILHHENTDLSFSPSVMGSALVAYSPNNLGVKMSLQTKYVGKQYINLAMDDASHLPAYTFTDFSISYDVKWKLAKKMRLTFFVKNIFDELYVTNAWSYRYLFDTQNAVDKGLYPQAGRNYYLMMNWSF